MSGNTDSVRLIKHKLTTSILYELYSHTKYYITFSTADNLMYSNNPQFSWLRCHWARLEDLPPQKKQAARENVGKEVILNVGGSRNYSIKVEIVSAEKETY